MNIGEASDINSLLKYILKLPRADAAVAHDAAVRLAVRARSRLRAGIGGPDVDLHWRDLADLIGDEIDAQSEALGEQAWAAPTDEGRKK